MCWFASCFSLLAAHTCRRDIGIISFGCASYNILQIDIIINIYNSLHYNVLCDFHIYILCVLSAQHHTFNKYIYIIYTLQYYRVSINDVWKAIKECARSLTDFRSYKKLLLKYNIGIKKKWFVQM